MKFLRTKQTLISIAALGLLLALALPVTALGQRGRNRDFDKRERKCAKFVNCHDARDGRRDGRGPQGDWDDRFGRNRSNRSDDWWERRRDRSRSDDRWERRRDRNRSDDRWERRRDRNRSDDRWERSNRNGRDRRVRAGEVDRRISGWRFR
jgi:hypothetical protein